MLLAHYKIGRNAGIARGCTVGGTSEHKEGRAVDWAVNVANPAQKAAGDAFVAWLTAVGPDGKVAYNARRLGVMYVIWNKRIWNNSSASSGWKPYTGAQPHTDHVHISLSWNGAYQRTSWWTGTALPTEATTRRYVALVYGHLFNRQVDPSGLTTWTTALTSGVPRTAVADSITSSTEYRSGLINGAYREFLGRSAEPAGLAGWLQHMVRGSTIQTMESGFLASPEYYGKAGSTDAGWVQMLYRHVLSREAAPAEIQGWVDRLSQGTSRQAVAMGFLISTERLTTVVDGYYQHLLGRGIDPAGQRTWVSSIQNGVRTEQIIASIVASAEYYLKAENYRGESRRRAIRARHRSPQDDDALERVRTETADRCEAVPEHDDPLGPGRQAAAPQAVAVGDPEHGQVQRAVGAPRDGDPHAVGERRAERGVLTALQRGRPEDLAGPHVPGLHRAVTVHDEAPADPHEDPNRGGAVPQHVTRADVEAAQTLVVLRAHQHHVRRAAVVHLCLHRLAREDGTGVPSGACHRPTAREDHTPKPTPGWLTTWTDCAPRPARSLSQRPSSRPSRASRTTPVRSSTATTAASAWTRGPSGPRGTRRPSSGVRHRSVPPTSSWRAIVSRPSVTPRRTTSCSAASPVRSAVGPVNGARTVPSAASTARSDTRSPTARPRPPTPKHSRRPVSSGDGTVRGRTRPRRAAARTTDGPLSRRHARRGCPPRSSRPARAPRSRPNAAAAATAHRADHRA
ncbi:DUF4214 domain-containing protein [Cellulomonas sp. ATA003]|nr:DUF4214 domain-containing protein [Cellulomonas sp. ATA003]WNB86757.1 DUF4214 domain-containing protein [Cellulomonas sp. ATA003]